MNERAILFGFLLFMVVILPILLVREYRQRREYRRIIDSYRSGRKGSNSEGETGAEVSPSGEESSPSVEDISSSVEDISPSGAKGWGMNNSPFRERKSGLSWGGGNIKASEAKRGARRKFLK